MQRLTRLAPVAALAAAMALAGCNDFLTGGELSSDPNRPSAATAKQLFTGAQANIWALYASDPSRVACIITQQCAGTNAQYQSLGESFSIDENTTNGFFTTLYAGGGLVDIRREQDLARQAGDTLFVGIAQVQEAMLMGFAADVFGDVPYSQVYQSSSPPKLDPQMAVYDSVQALLSRAITNLAARSATNVGPGASDLVYAGNRTKWTQLAHTLKARFYLHTAEVRPGAYAQALAEARQGITDPANNYEAVYSGNAGEQNLLYQFENARPGYIAPGTFITTLLQTRKDPRLGRFFTTDLSDFADPYAYDPTASQPIVTAQENLLILAESAYRTGDQAAARTALNQEQTIEGVPLTGASVSGNALLQEILTEKYIALFGTLEPWNDYKRTCFPNLPVPETARGKKFPARLLYDASERQTNPNIPAAQSQPARNANDPANATDPFGNRCLGQ